MAGLGGREMAQLASRRLQGAVGCWLSLIMEKKFS